VGPIHRVAGRTVANLSAYHAAFLTSAFIALAGAALALVVIKDVDAANTRSHLKVPRVQRAPRETARREVQ
jgi:hypothetical protein